MNRNTALHKCQRVGAHLDQEHRLVARQLEDARANGHHRPLVDHTRRRPAAAHCLLAQEEQDMAKVQAALVHRLAAQREQHTDQERPRSVHVLLAHRCRGRRGRDGELSVKCDLKRSHLIRQR